MLYSWVLLAQVVQLRIPVLANVPAGKSTHASNIQDEFCICCLSPGGVLQSQLAKRTSAGKDAKEIVERGGVVTAEIMTDMICHELENDTKCRNGFVLDGFPRNLSEFTRLEQALEARHRMLNHVIELKTDDRAPETRISGRLVHLSSGRSYHDVFCPPKEPMKDDITGEPLIRRPSDRSEVARARLADYRAHTQLISEYYKQMGIWAQVDGDKKPNEVYKDISSILRGRAYER